MLDRIIAFSLKNRLLVLAAALGVTVFGGYAALTLPIDVFPDLNRPTVTVMTEAPGLAPEEVEALVTFPLETALNGATRVQRVRSASGVGLSIVWVEFDWGSDLYIDRQVVAEKLSSARERLPAGTHPELAPVSSIMGEIQLIGMSGTNGSPSLLEMRELADWTVRPRLLSIPGVSQVTVLGGGARQIQVLTSPERLAAYGVTLDQLSRAVEAANASRGGGFLQRDARELLIRITGRAESLEEIGGAPVAPREGDAAAPPLRVRDVADVRWGSPVPRGDGSVNGATAVILSVQKQPNADTIGLTRAIDAAVADLSRSICGGPYAGVVFHRDVFRQEEFIQAAIANVKEAIRDGVLWVVLVLFLFLWNVRTSFITITAIPLSIVLTAILFRMFGLSVNTMTLGGLAVAIGELVDDSIVDIENIFRRLKENRHKPVPEPVLKVVYAASREVRNSIVYATAVTVLVVFPLFFLTGLEGRMFLPLGLSYLLTLLMSLAVSLTVTPVLSSYLLPRAKVMERERDPFLLRWLKRGDEKLLGATLRRPYAVLCGAGLLAALSIAAFLAMGKEFLPPFNEGTFTVNLRASPGTSLAESNRLGAIAERMLHEIPEVVSTARRTGRAEMDEHAEGVNSTDLEIRIRSGGRPRDQVAAEIRDRFSSMAGVDVNLGQPISHRLDHIMSGIRAQVAVKAFGPDLLTLRALAHRIEDEMAGIPGVVDLQVEPQVEIPQLRIRIKKEEAAQLGLSAQTVAQALETALRGTVAGQVLDQQKLYDLAVWYDEASRNDPDVIRQTLLTTPQGRTVALSQVAEVLETTGPNTINRENVTRRIVVSCNVAGRPLGSVVRAIQDRVAAHVQPALAPGYFIEYGGQFEAQQEASRRLLIFGGLALAGVFALLVKCLGSWQAALQCLVNVPLAAVGALIALCLTAHPDWNALHAAPLWQWPRIYLQGITLSIASLVGLITLTGIVIRNGIMMISHYLHLVRHEGERFDEKMIVRGSLERLAPVLMTAATAVIGLVPLLLGAGQTGKEILHPLAVVVVGGLVSSTLLDQVVTPALFLKFGRKAHEKSLAPTEDLLEASAPKPGE